MDKKISTPIYIIEESLLRQNLQTIATVAQRGGFEVILALKAFALWKTFPIIKEYVKAAAASSLFEAQLATEGFEKPAYTFSPAYTLQDINTLAHLSSHITFNSLNQFYTLTPQALRINPSLSIGLRINPGESEIPTPLYNPCMPGTRFGIRATSLPQKLPIEVEGFHCHCHCESGAEALQRTINRIEEQFYPWLNQIKWLNLGGGHLITNKDYNTELLISIIHSLKHRYPKLHIILEPGSAFVWRTGTLIATVIDIVKDCNIKTAILDMSFTCHTPDCLEMPYQPEIEGAHFVKDTEYDDPKVFRLGGNSCLAGDYLGFWKFDEQLTVGQQVVFKDMIHYTTVKTTMFNGIKHPDIAMLHSDGHIEILRSFAYKDYKNRMD